MKNLRHYILGGLAALTLSFSLSAFADKPISTKDVEKGDVVFYLTRHGKTMLNTTDRVQGWSDAVLTPAGIEVAEQLGKGLASQSVKFVAAVSSDSGRAMETMRIVLDKSRQNKLVPSIDWRFREFNFGTYEGEPNHTLWTDLGKQEGKTMQEWMKTMTPKSFADGVALLDKDKVKPGVNWPAENYEAISKRLTTAMDELAKKVSAKGGGNVLIVSHGLSILTVLDVLGGNEFQGKPLRNASVSKLRYSKGKFTILSVDDMSYVEAGK